MSIKVKPRSGEEFHWFKARFNHAVGKSGVLTEYLRHQYYESKGRRRRRRLHAANCKRKMESLESQA